VCYLDAHDLARAEVTVRLDNGPYVPRLGCALGSRKPPAPYQVIVYRGGARLGQLCH
jgi:hypothetical protein